MTHSASPSPFTRVDPAISAVYQGRYCRYSLCEGTVGLSLAKTQSASTKSDLPMERG
jgi:hypothetical protein